MEVINETLWKRCFSTPTKPPAKNSNIFLSETAYQHKGTRKKCKKTNQAAIIQWQRHDRSRKQATFLSRVPVHCITPFCSDALVSPPNLYPPCLPPSGPRSEKLGSEARQVKESFLSLTGQNGRRVTKAHLSGLSSQINLLRCSVQSNNRFLVKTFEKKTIF